MNAYCPECETELDQATGICPACRWDPFLSAARQQVAPTEPEISLTERYRGTQYDLHIASMTEERDAGISRGRMFVLIAAVAAVGLYAVAMGVMGMI